MNYSKIQEIYGTPLSHVPTPHRTKGLSKLQLVLIIAGSSFAVIGIFYTFNGIKSLMLRLHSDKSKKA